MTKSEAQTRGGIQFWRLRTGEVANKILE